MGYKDPDRGAAAERRRHRTARMKKEDAAARRVNRLEKHIEECNECESLEEADEHINEMWLEHERRDDL